MTSYFTIMTSLYTLWACLWCCGLTHAAYSRYYMDKDCYPEGDLKNISDPDESLYGFIEATSGIRYKTDMNCSVHLLAPEGYFFTIRIRRIETYVVLVTGTCDPDYLQLVGVNEGARICGRGAPEDSFTSEARVAEVRFVSGDHDNQGNYMGFELYYTAFHKGDCGKHEYKCKDGRCIPDEVVCDNYDNCGDWSDEGISGCGLSTFAIIMIILFCCAIAICMAGIIYYCYKEMSLKKQRNRLDRVHNLEQSAHANTISTGDDFGMPNYQSGGAAPPPYSQKYDPTTYPPPGGPPPQYGDYPGPQPWNGAAPYPIPTGDGAAPVPYPIPPGAVPIPYPVPIPIPTENTGETNQQPINEAPPIYNRINTTTNQVSQGDESANQQTAAAVAGEPSSDVTH